MLWLDELFIEASEKLPELIKVEIQNSPKGKKNFYKKTLARYDQMNLVEKALNYIGMEYSSSPMDMALRGSFQYGYISLHIVCLFLKTINKEHLVPEVFQLVNLMVERSKIEVRMEGEGYGHALKVSHRLINDFIDTKAPSLSLNEVLGNNFYYIELPRKFLLLGEFKVYSIFIHKTHIILVTESALKHKKYDLVLHEIGKDEDMVSGGGSLLTLLFMEVQDQIFNLVKMIILYQNSTNKKSRSLMMSDANISSKSHLDKRYSKLIKGIKKEVCNVNNKPSMFKLVYLTKPIRDEGWRKNNSNKNQWTLSKKIAVTGHWRWQPHGEKMAKRKLIYIQEHMRGSGESDDRAAMNLIN